MADARDFGRLVDFVRSIYGDGDIPLHRPVFVGREREYLVDCIDSNFVSSVGARVTELERTLAAFTGCAHGVATMNGTAALHMALQLVGVRRDEEVITQALTFIATCNALSYIGAVPVFVDVDRDTLGLGPGPLREFLQANVVVRDGHAWNRHSGRRIAACVPMHTFGLPCRITEIVAICDEYAIPVVEDAAESLGSYVEGRHTGGFGRIGTLSFNGNKIITTGGGGMLVSDDAELMARAKHLTTTAKKPHPYEFVHDEVGYNYRMPNLNAALGCAQVEMLPAMLQVKRDVAARYAGFFADAGITMAAPIAGAVANHWLNAIVLDEPSERDALLQFANARGVMMRPIWRLMPSLPMYAACQHDGLDNSRWLEARVVNVPSSVPDAMLAGISAGDALR